MIYQWQSVIQSYIVIFLSAKILTGDIYSNSASSEIPFSRKTDRTAVTSKRLTTSTVMTPEDKRQLYSLKWYHRIELGDGIITPGLPWEGLWALVEEAIHTLDLRGKRVLDVGCWDGKWTFLAESLGATVTATDWVSQRWGGRDTFLFASKVLGSKATYMPQCDVCRLKDTFRCGSFDVVFFLGVLYHLRYPMFALSQIRRVLGTNGVLVLESHAVKDDRTSAIYFNYCGAGMEDKSNWSVPTTLALRKMVQSCYFQIQQELHFLIDLRSPLKKAVRRLIYPKQKEHIRVVIVATAVEREDSGYAYPDSFLSTYDPRFKT